MIKFRIMQQFVCIKLRQLVLQRIIHCCNQNWRYKQCNITHSCFRQFLIYMNLLPGERRKNWPYVQGSTNFAVRKVFLVQGTKFSGTYGAIDWLYKMTNPSITVLFYTYLWNCYRWLNSIARQKLQGKKQLKRRH